MENITPLQMLTESSGEPNWVIKTTVGTWSGALGCGSAGWAERRIVNSPVSSRAAEQVLNVWPGRLIVSCQLPKNSSTLVAHVGSERGTKTEAWAGNRLPKTTPLPALPGGLPALPYRCLIMVRQWRAICCSSCVGTI